jgi:hypothetical protein
MGIEHRVGWDPHFIARSPWLWPLAAVAEPLRARPRWPSHSELDAIYARCAERRGARCLNFRPAQPRARHRAAEPRPIELERIYDGRIALTSVVTTRAENWHDLLNALCFATWPKSKLALHERQYRALIARLEPDALRLPPTRSPEQDALTIFDEGGVVIAALRDTAAALALLEPSEFESAVQRSLVARRTRVIPFGHALFEHMVEGLVCPGGSARIVALDAIAGTDACLLDAADDALAKALADPASFSAPRQANHLRLQRLEAPAD